MCTRRATVRLCVQRTARRNRKMGISASAAPKLCFVGGNWRGYCFAMGRPVQRFARFFFASAVISLCGCAGKEAAKSQSNCIAGESIACISATGCHGYKLCADDGTRYGVCDCSVGTSTGGSTSTSAMGSGGSEAASGGNPSAGGSMSISTAGSGNTSGGNPSAGGATSAQTMAVGGRTSSSTSSSPTLAGSPGISQGGASGAVGTSFRAHATCPSPGNCSKCITLASFGTPASKSYGTASDTTTEFESWLTSTSNADVTFVLKKPASFTLEWLNAFDVIILQDLRTWTFTTDEVAAFQSWIAGGGGVIALSGYYTSDTTEIAPTNQLLAKTGLSLLATETPGQTCAVSSATLCPNTKASATPKCYCWGNTLPITSWNLVHPIATNLTAIGSFRGRAVSPGTGVTVADYEGTPVAAASSIGAGKVFLFGDETVTYVSQWLAGGSPTTDPYNPCWDEQAATSCLAGHVFQYKQFWFNAISYVAPASMCTFKIADQGVILN